MFITVVVGVTCSFMLYSLWLAYHTAYWAPLYEVRNRFAAMPDVRIVSEAYSEELLSVDYIRMHIEVRGKGTMMLASLSDQSFTKWAQFWIDQVGDCRVRGGVQLNKLQTEYPPLRYNVREAIDNYDTIYDVPQKSDRK